MDLNSALKYGEEDFELKIDTTPPEPPPPKKVRPTKPGGYPVGGYKRKADPQPEASAPTETPPSLAKLVEWEPGLPPPSAANSDPDFLLRPTPPDKPPVRITLKPPAAPNKGPTPTPVPEGFAAALSAYRKQPPPAASQSFPPALPPALAENALPTGPYTVVKKGQVQQPFKLPFRAAVANRLNSLAGELADRHHQEVASQLGISPDAAKFLIGDALRSNLKLALLLHKQPDRQLKDYKYTLRKGDKNATIEGTYS